MEPKETPVETMPSDLSEQFKKAILEREIKRRESLAEFEEEGPGPLCEPDENGACEVCSG
jgi:uncharacterized protein YqeY